MASSFLFQAAPFAIGAMNGIGAYFAGQQAEKFADQQADAVEKAGEITAAAIAINRRKLAGAQRVAQAASGVVVDEGSALDLLVDNFLLGLMEEYAARFATTSRANAIRTQGDIAKQQGIVQLGTSILGGALGSFDRGLFSASPTTTTIPAIPSPKAPKAPVTSTRSGGALVFGQPVV